MATDVYPPMKYLDRPVELMNHANRREKGIILISGMPFSGVTTTLTALAHMFKDNANVVYLRGPSNDALPGIDSLTYAELDQKILDYVEYDGRPDVLVIDDIQSPALASLVVRLATRGATVIMGLKAVSPSSAVENFKSIIPLQNGITEDTVNKAIRISVHQQFVTPSPGKLDNDKIMLNYSLGHATEMFAEANPELDVAEHPDVNVIYSVLENPSHFKR